jgi:6-phosphogluconolactonase
MKNKVVVLSHEDWLYSVIKELESVILKVVKNNLHFNLAISGGNTPIPLFEKMEMKFADDDLWHSFVAFVNIFWVDERPVSVDSPQSNVGSALKYLKNTGLNIFPINGNAPDLSKEAEAYQQLIGKTIKVNENHLPIFDLILLGIGDDGHVASLFPESNDLHENEKWVIANWIPQLLQTRLTLTFPVILASQKIWMLSNQQKLGLIEKVLEGKVKNLPINHLIDNYPKEIKWFITE